MARKVRFLIKHHLRSNQYSDHWTDSAVRRFAREMEPHLTTCSTCRAPTSRRSGPAGARPCSRQISDAAGPRRAPARGRRGAAAAAGRRRQRDHDRFELPPSRRIGELKRLLEDAIEKGELEARREDEYYLDWLAPRLADGSDG